jgi:hypothetical protein
MEDAGCGSLSLPPLPLTRATVSLHTTYRTPLEHADATASKGTLPKVCGDMGGQDTFKRGATDTFMLRGQTDVGKMAQIEVSHDDSGLCAGESLILHLEP